MIVYEGNLTKCGTKERESRAGAWIYEGYCGALWTYCGDGLSLVDDGRRA